jgi:hypothetical protein
MFRHTSATPGFALLQRRHPDRPQQVEQGGRQHRADGEANRSANVCH